MSAHHAIRGADHHVPPDLPWALVDGAAWIVRRHVSTRGQWLASTAHQEGGPMFGLFRRRAPRPLSEALHRAIEKDGGTSAIGDSSQLRMIESTGRYSDRKVTYFRIFVPVLAAQQSLDVRKFNDLDQHQDLIVRSGHLETDGTIVLTRPVVVRPAERLSRAQADRTMHLDDAHIVSGETGASSNAPAPR